jgi:thymidylate synthase (FAD)
MLLGHTPEPEKAVAMAARLCHTDAGIPELAEGLSSERAAALIRDLRNMGHLSPFEHASFSFGISGVSRALSHQLVRHRIASYSQKSQRYVSESRFDYVTPATVAANPEALRLFEEAMRSMRNCYDALVKLGVPGEDARYVLPNACTTQLMCTFNARSLLNFFELRCCSRAQEEIRSLAWKMLELVRAVAPSIFENAGPPCVSEGRCREGRLSCGMYRKSRTAEGPTPDRRSAPKGSPGMGDGAGS